MVAENPLEVYLKWKLMPRYHLIKLNIKAPRRPDRRATGGILVFRNGYIHYHLLKYPQVVARDSQRILKAQTHPLPGMVD